MQIRANGITLEVEDHGPRNGAPLLLIMGLGMQLLGWPDEFVDLLASRGFRVVRFDNRDIGLSQHFDPLGVPNIAWQSVRHLFGARVTAPYSLANMADDSVGVLDALGIASAHVCGASMGGMVAQRLALRHPARVASLTLMMTTSGAPRLPGATAKARAALLARPADPHSIDSVVAHFRQLYRAIGSPAYPPDAAWLTERLIRSARRSVHPQGTVRQLMAIVADGDRSPLLHRIAQPTQIIHGNADPLVRVAAAHDLMAKIGGARLDLIDGMGHDLPPPLFGRFADAIGTAAARAQAAI